MGQLVEKVSVFGTFFVQIDEKLQFIPKYMIHIFVKNYLSVSEKYIMVLSVAIDICFHNTRVFIGKREVPIMDKGEK